MRCKNKLDQKDLNIFYRRIDKKYVLKKHGFGNRKSSVKSAIDAKKSNYLGYFHEENVLYLTTQRLNSYLCVMSYVGSSASIFLPNLHE